jgi:hypothetical protein
VSSDSSLEIHRVSRVIGNWRRATNCAHIRICIFERSSKHESNKKYEILNPKFETNSNDRNSNVQNKVLNFGNLNFDIVSDL